MPDPLKPGDPGYVAPAPAAAGAAAPPEVRYIDANIEAIKQRHGGSDAAIRHLFHDAKRARDAKRLSDKTLADFQAELAKGVVLKGDDVKTWEAFTKLGKKPDELATLLTEHGTLKEKVSKADRSAMNREAAKLTKFNPDALDTLATDKNIAIVLKTEKVNDKDEQVPYVQPPEANAAPIKLTEYVEKHLAIYKPALTQQNTQHQNGAGGSTDSARRTPFVDQSSSSRSSATDTANKPPLRDTRVLPSQRGVEGKKP